MKELLQLADDLGGDVFLGCVFLFFAMGLARAGLAALSQMIGTPLAVKNFWKDTFVAGLCLLSAVVIFKVMQTIIMNRVETVFKVLQ